MIAIAAIHFGIAKNRVLREYIVTALTLYRLKSPFDSIEGWRHS
jgi:hypothetical protein